MTLCPKGKKIEGARQQEQQDTTYTRQDKNYGDTSTVLSLSELSVYQLHNFIDNLGLGTNRKQGISVSINSSEYDPYPDNVGSGIIEF